MGRHGALAYWLLQMLVLLTGNLDRPGGNIPSTRGTQPCAPLARARSRRLRRTRPWGRYRPTSGGQPGALLGSMLGDADQPIRALVSMAGNPRPQHRRAATTLADAFAELELLVTVDYYRNATGELADYVLPAADWFEREDLNTFVQGTQPEPYVQWAGPLVEPRGERRTERDIFAALAERLGHPPVFGPDADMLAMLYDGALAEQGLSMAALHEADRGVALLAPTDPGGFLDRTTDDGTVDGDPAMLEPARRRAVELFDEMAAEPDDQLKLITRRTSHTINSAMQNVERLKKGAGADNPLYLCPADAERLAITDGAKVRVSNRYGSIEAFARVDDTLRVGVVAMTHGFGNVATTGQPVAQRFRRRERQRPRPGGAGHLRPGEHDVAADRHPGRGRARLSEPVGSPP